MHEPQYDKQSQQAYITLNSGTLDYEVLKNGEWLVAGRVASQQKFIEDKIFRNDLPFNEGDYMKLAASSQGIEGAHYVIFNGTLYFVAIRGGIRLSGQKFYVVRTVVKKGNVTPAKLEELAQIPSSLAGMEAERLIKRIMKRKK